MSEDYKMKIVEANNKALTQHFLKLLFQLEERVAVLEVKLQIMLKEVDGVMKEVKKHE